MLSLTARHLVVLQDSRVVMLDNPGQGLSTDYSQDPLTIKRMAAATEALLDEAGITRDSKPVLLGWCVAGRALLPVHSLPGNPCGVSANRQALGHVATALGYVPVQNVSGLKRHVFDTSEPAGSLTARHCCACS